MDRFPFSNFEPARVHCAYGFAYPTVEHAFQAAKTLDPEERRKVAALPTPGQAKRAGRRLTLRPDWKTAKVQVMYDLLRQKFRPGTPAARALLETGTAEIVEWNRWHDQTWGRCSCNRCEGRGRNLLGVLLMRVRKELASGPKAPSVG